MTAYEMCISDWSSDVCSSDLVDEHVDRAELRLDLVEGAGDRFGFAHVAGDRDRLGADRAHRGESGFEMVGLAAKDRDLRAQPGELDRHALAEPGAAAGYRDHLSVIGPVGQRLGAGRGRGGKGHPLSPCSWASASAAGRRGGKECVSRGQYAWEWVL